MFLEIDCMLYDRQICYLIYFFQGVPKLKISSLSIKGNLEKLDKLNPLSYMTNGSKNKKTKFCNILTPWSGSLRET